MRITFCTSNKLIKPLVCLRTILLLCLLAFSLKGFSQPKEKPNYIDTLRALKPNFHSLKIDSLSKSYFRNLKGNNIKNFNAKYFSTLDTSGKSLTTLLNIKNTLSRDFQKGMKQFTSSDRFKNLIPLPANFYKNPVVLHNANAQYNRIDNEGSYVTPSGRTWYGDFEVNSSWSIATIPFDIQVNNQTWSDVSNNNFSNLGIHFNK